MKNRPTSREGTCHSAYIMWDDRFQPTDTSNAERRFLARLVNSGGHAEADVRQVRPEWVTKRGDTKLIVLRWLARSDCVCGKTAQENRL